MSGRTKEERYILQLYRSAKEQSNEYAVFDCYQIGEKIGYSERLVKNTVKLLAQANFIRKKDNEIYLTDHGLSLISTLRER